jgi:hypothetical protein
LPRICQSSNTDGDYRFDTTTLDIRGFSMIQNIEHIIVAEYNEYRYIATIDYIKFYIDLVPKESRLNVWLDGFTTLTHIASASYNDQYQLQHWNYWHREYQYHSQIGGELYEAVERILNLMAFQ